MMRNSNDQTENYYNEYNEGSISHFLFINFIRILNYSSISIIIFNGKQTVKFLAAFKHLKTKGARSDII